MMKNNITDWVFDTFHLDTYNVAEISENVGYDITNVQQLATVLEMMIRELVAFEEYNVTENMYANVNWNELAEWVGRDLTN
jgi:hypothetical protein